jgi:hypothetical protein
VIEKKRSYEACIQSTNHQDSRSDRLLKAPKISPRRIENSGSWSVAIVKDSTVDNLQSWQRSQFDLTGRLSTGELLYYDSFDGIIHLRATFSCLHNQRQSVFLGWQRTARRWILSGSNMLPISEENSLTFRTVLNIQILWCIECVEYFFKHPIRQAAVISSVFDSRMATTSHIM